MTAGHPDWQTYSSWRAAPFVSAFSQSIPAGVTSSAVVPIPHYSGVTIRCLTHSGTVVCQLTGTADAAGLEIVQVTQWCLPPLVSLAVQVPVIAPYVQWSVTALGGVGAVVDQYVQPANIAAVTEEYFSNRLPQPLAFASASVAAAGGLTVSTSEIYAGPVIAAVQTSSGTSYHGSVQYFDNVSLGLLALTRFSGGTLGQGGQFLIAAPTSQMTIGVTNDDSVARTLSVTLLRAA